MLSFSERRHGSQDIIINTISNNSTAPMQCLVFGCYFTSDWFDLYLVKSLEFTLEPAPLVLPSPSPSPSIIPSPDPALHSKCECENIEKREKRETTEGTTSEQGNEKLYYFSFSSFIILTYFYHRQSKRFPLYSGCYIGNISLCIDCHKCAASITV